ncbi:MAG: hypothetical protein H7Y12_07460 [Sphingobacteriaceae bacterium]|nr:hypothetical protein [Cytophagaceae bacterium]
MFDLNPLNNPNATWQHWLLAIVAGLIGFVIGYISRKREAEALEPQLARLETEVEECLSSKAVASTSAQVRVAPLPVPPPPAPVVLPEPEPMPGVGFITPSPMVLPVATPADDLKIVEGIGPKIEELLNNEGILTFEQLAVTSPEHLTQILRAAGPRFQIQDPATWPRQAQLAADEDWDGLKQLQNELTAGRA